MLQEMGIISVGEFPLLYLSERRSILIAVYLDLTPSSNQPLCEHQRN